MTVIENESSFNPKIRGTSGEIGLMQVLPRTAEWIARRVGIKWKGEKTLEDPVTNIRIGSAHLAQLREEFKSQGQLYLAAYNMGSGNVQRALAKQVWPKDYPVRVMSRYLKFYSDFKQARAQEKEKAAPVAPARTASTASTTRRS
jgi:soluble lytic murein transglycosylase